MAVGVTDIKLMATAPRDGSEITLLILVPVKAHWDKSLGPSGAWVSHSPERDIELGKPIGWKPIDKTSGEAS